jgi:hypothetical protein
MTLNRWPHSRTPTTTPRVHSLPAASSPRIHHPPPVKLRARSVHAKVAPLRAVDLACFQKPVLVSGSHPHVCGSCNGSVPVGRVCCDNVVSQAQPAPVPAPEVPHVWAAGMDALFNGPVRFAARDMTPGRVYRVRGTIGDCLLVTDDVGDGANVIASSFTPATAPAPATGEREWRVDDRVRVVAFDCAEDMPSVVGQLGTVVSAYPKPQASQQYTSVVRLDSGGACWGFRNGDLEPAPAVESERG